jgi:putative ABC transport system substrate-binding protein
MNNRRKLVIALGTSALVVPLSSFAQQQGKVWRVGFLGARSRSTPSNPDVYYDAFVQGMRDLGYVEGQNLVIDGRFSDGKNERLPDLAAELVKLKVNVIMAAGTPATLAAQKATATIPIVMIAVGDPVGDGLVKSLARPGGNSTGISNISADLGPKHLEMLLSMIPKLTRVVVLVNLTNLSSATYLKNIQTAIRSVNVRGLPLKAQTPQEIENAFSTMAREKPGAVIVVQDSFIIQQRHQIIELAAKHRLPSISGWREYAEAGGLMSYGANFADLYRRTAVYVDKIFKGAKPANLPVEQPTKFELIINGKTAKALGLKIPQSLLISADKVIE